MGWAILIAAVGKLVANRSTQGRPLPQLFQTFQKNSWFWFGLMIIAIGSAGVSQSWLEVGIWVMIAFFSGFFSLTASTGKL